MEEIIEDCNGWTIKSYPEELQDGIDVKDCCYIAKVYLYDQIKQTFSGETRQEAISKAQAFCEEIPF